VPFGLPGADIVKLFTAVAGEIRDKQSSLSIISKNYGPKSFITFVPEYIKLDKKC